MAIQQLIKKSALLSAAMTINWVIFTAISMSQIKPSWSDLDYLKWVSNPDVFYTVNYVNATVLTFAVVWLFTLLFMYFLDKNKKLALIGLMFIPFYGVMNIVCYSIQITIVPSIAYNTIRTSGDILFAMQLVQSKSESVIGFINGLAYSILGIPSIIYGYMLFKDIKKISGIFLLINGALCIIGIVGYLAKNTILASGVMVGGIAFLISLVFIIFEFGKKQVIKQN
ncbi:MAG: hypothetical protein ACOZCL_19350 [Bacillota bacterium]